MTPGSGDLHVSRIFGSLNHDLSTVRHVTGPFSVTPVPVIPVEISSQRVIVSWNLGHKVQGELYEDHLYQKEYWETPI